MVSGSDSRSEPSQLSDRDLVESVLRDLSEAADKWEALVTQAETVTYSVDLGDVRAVANSDGRLLELTLHPGVMTGYAHGELADRVNLAITGATRLRPRTGHGTAAACSDIGICEDQAHLLARHFGAGRKAHSRAVATLKADIQAWHPAGIQTPKPRCESDVFARIGHTSHPSTRKSRVGPGASEAPLA